MEHSHVRGTLEISVRAQTASLAQVRRLLRPFLAEHHVREDQRHGVVLVTHELTANAIVHGSTDEGEMIAIAITLEPRFVLIRVLDPAHTGAIRLHSSQPSGANQDAACSSSISWRPGAKGSTMVAEVSPRSSRSGSKALTGSPRRGVWD